MQSLECVELLLFVLLPKMSVPDITNLGLVNDSTKKALRSMSLPIGKPMILQRLSGAGLSNNREIRVFPGTAGNTGISREILGNTGKYEI